MKEVESEGEVNIGFVSSVSCVAVAMQGCTMQPLILVSATRPIAQADTRTTVFENSPCR